LSTKTTPYSSKSASIVVSVSVSEADSLNLRVPSYKSYLTNLSQFKHKGLFIGWIRRIMVNTCISRLRKKNMVTLSDDDFINTFKKPNNKKSSTCCKSFTYCLQTRNIFGECFVNKRCCASLLLCIAF
jgi:hypothetical protein